MSYAAILAVASASFGVSAEASCSGPSLRALTRPVGEMVSSYGQQVAFESLYGEKATVLLFLSTECPISNGYAPTMNRLVREFRDRGVSFIGVNPNAGQSLRDVEVHRIRYDLKFPVLKDPGGKLAEALGAAVCPTAVVFNGSGEAVYRGRIDDRYPRRGGAPKQVIHHHDLEDCLKRLAEGQSPDPVETEVVGCPVVAVPTGVARAVDPKATFSRDVAAILQKHCQECHRSGGIGPFPLTTYQETLPWADAVVEFTANRTMPIWKPAPGHGNFRNVRRMSDEEIATLALWVEEGCPEGDPSDLPPPRSFEEGWRLGRPDLVFQPAEPYTLAAEGPDEYRHFVIPTNLQHDVYISAMEVSLGNPRVDHHVIVFLDPYGTSEKLDAADPSPGYVTAGGSPGFVPPGALGGHAPGNIPARLPDGVARIIPKGARLVLQMHYHKSGKEEVDHTKIGLYLCETPPKRLLRDIAVTPYSALPLVQIPFLSKGIPAGEPRYTIREKTWVPEDLELLAARPHMHLIGKEMTVTARLPDGSTQPIIRIEDWDFNWQENYYYERPVFLPKGTCLELEAVFDNSSENPANPFQPPREVKWGEATTDEMAFCFLEVVPTRDAQSDRDLQLESVTDFLRNWVQYQIRGPHRRGFRLPPLSQK